MPPLLEFECPKCGVIDVFLFASEDRPTKCTQCGRKGFHRVFVTAPRVYGDRADWSNENSGKGRFCPQMARFPKDPAAYATSCNKLIDWGKRRGLTASKD